MKIAVVGAHLSGLPLNGQLLERGATLVRAARTAPPYRLYELPNTAPPKPGLLRVPGRGGAGIELEVWEMGPEPFATFVDAIPAPLGIGSVELEDGQTVKGFLVESYAVEGARDITDFGGWRNYLKAKK
jgi:allophanate hydrolase